MNRWSQYLQAATFHRFLTNGRRQRKTTQGVVAIKDSPSLQASLILLIVSITACQRQSDPLDQDNQTSFLQRRAEFETTLLNPGPSPQAFEEEVPPEGVMEITYHSGDLRLKAWVYNQHAPSKGPQPAIVYLHGGFAFGASDLYDCRPFIEAGFVVMTPWLRGENGQDGNFECYWGELDDAEAAVRWAAEQPYVDPNNLYVFGHSSGGQLAALMSLCKDVPIVHSGSSGGLYDSSVFSQMPNDRVPFDSSNPIECQLRVLPGNLRWMNYPHYAFVGNEDTPVLAGLKTAKPEIDAGEGNLRVKILTGDHFATLQDAMMNYIAVIRGSSDSQ